MINPRLVLLALAGALAWSCVSAPPSAVVVTVGGLRADAIDPVHAPRLAAMAAEGTSVRTLTPSPATVPALAGMWTGSDPDRLGFLFADIGRLPKDVPTLAAVLHERGYETRAYVGAGEVSTLTGLARGFDSYWVPSAPAVSAVMVDEPERVRPWRGGALPANAVVGEMLSYLAARPNKNPLFLWVHLADLEEGLDPADPRGSYQRQLSAVDSAIGLVRDAIDSYGLAGRTTLVVASTHGLSLGDNGEVRSGLTLGDSVARVPVIAVGREHARFRDLRSLVGLEPRLAAVLDAASREAGEAGALALARLPSRAYGWPDEALFVKGDAELALGAMPRWRLGAQLIEGPAALEHAGPEIKRRLEEAGVRLDAAPVAPEQRQAVLALIGDAFRAATGGDAAASATLLTRAAELAPRALAPRLALAQQGPGSVAEAEIAGLRELAGDDPARLIDVARLAAERGSAEQAIAILDALPGQRNAGEEIAVAEILAGTPASDRALEILRQHAEGDPEAPEIQEWLGDLLARGGDAYRAKLAYEQALGTARARTPNLVAKLGNCLAELGDKDAALQKYAEAVALDPTYRFPHSRAGQILLEKGDQGAAAHAFVSSVRKSGDAVRDVLDQAAVLSRNGLYSFALGHINDVLREHPDDVRLRIGRAQVLATAGEHDRARAELRGILERDGSVAQAWVALARVEVSAGKQDAALAALERAEKISGSAITDTVRNDPVFAKWGADSPLARRARAFQGQGSDRKLATGS